MYVSGVYRDNRCVSMNNEVSKGFCESEHW